MNVQLSSPELPEILRRQLRLDRPLQSISSSLQEALGTASDEEPLVLRGECDGFPVEILPKRFFIAQEFSENESAFRRAVEDALGELGWASIRADDAYWGGRILCKILALVAGTHLGVYQLSVSQNRNVYLEMGIALGLNRPFILVKERDAEVPNILKGIEYYQINSYLETAYQLGPLVQQYVASISTYLPVRQPIIKRENAVVIAHGNQEAIDNTVVIGQQLAQYGYRCLIVGNFDVKIARFLDKAGVQYSFLQTLEEITNGVIGATFGIYRIDKRADADTFVALGIAIAGNKHRLLVNNARDIIPSDLSGFETLTFHGHVDLERKLQAYLAPWLTKHGLRT